VTLELSLSRRGGDLRDLRMGERDVTFVPDDTDAAVDRNGSMELIEGRTRAGRDYRANPEPATTGAPSRVSRRRTD